MWGGAGCLGGGPDDETLDAGRDQQRPGRQDGLPLGRGQARAEASGDPDRQAQRGPAGQHDGGQEGAGDPGKGEGQEPGQTAAALLRQEQVLVAMAMYMRSLGKLVRSGRVSINKTRTSKVGAISKAQKAQNIFFLKKNLKIFVFFSFGKCRIVPKNVKEGTIGIYLHTFSCKVSKNSNGGPFSSIRIPDSGQSNIYFLKNGN